MDDFQFEAIAAWIMGEMGVSNPYLLASMLISFMMPAWKVMRGGYRLIRWLAPAPSDLCRAMCDALEDGPVDLDGPDDCVVSAGKVSVNTDSGKILTQEACGNGTESAIHANELLSKLDRNRVLYMAACARDKVLARRRRDRKRKAAVMVAAWRESS